jgi:hypothetical protein
VHSGQAYRMVVLPMGQRQSVAIAHATMRQFCLRRIP